MLRADFDAAHLAPALYLVNHMLQFVWAFADETKVIDTGHSAYPLPAMGGGGAGVGNSAFEVPAEFGEEYTEY